MVGRRATGAILGGFLAAGAATALLAPETAAADSGQGLSGQAVLWVAVSPAYQTTGLVIAETQPLSCSGSACNAELWVSHNGGHSWSRAAATGWQSGRPTIIASNSTPHDTIFGPGTSAIQRSDDGGDTWQQVGTGGVPTATTSYAKDGTVAVGSTHDYILKGTSTSAVPGSNGSMNDYSFAFSPATTGSPAGALLSGTMKSGSTPAVERCDTHLSCSGAVPLSGSSQMSGPPNLFLSTTFGADGVAFAQTATGVYKTSDGGHTFAPLAIGVANATTTAVPMMALAPDYSEKNGVKTAYAAVIQLLPAASGGHPTTSGGLYRTVDGGATWTALDSPGGPFSQGAFAVAVAPDGRIFAANLNMQGQGGLLCSTDGGQTWQVTCPAVGSGEPHPAGTTSASGKTSACGSPTCSGGSAATRAGAAPGSSNSGSQAAGGSTAGGGTQGAGSSSELVGHAGVPSTGHSWLLPGILAVVLLLGAGVSGVVRSRRRPKPAE